MKISKILIISSVLLLAGCASDSKRIVDLNLNYVTASSVPTGGVDKNAQAQLAEAASSVNQSLQQLSAIQVAKNPNVKIPTLNPAATGMTQQASIDWNGPVEPILNKIASATGYHLRILGSNPAIAVLVSIDADNQTMAEILRNVTYQVEKKASVSVYPATKIIELRYYAS